MRSVLMGHTTTNMEFSNSMTYFHANWTNATDPMETTGNDLYKTILIVFIVLVISLLTVLGNVAIILCIVRNRNMLTIYNVYTVSLAFADLLVGVIVMPLMVVYTYLGYWPMGDNFCTMWIVFDCTCCTVSMLHLDAIAFDRYKSVSTPLFYRSSFTKIRAVKISVVMWLLGFVFWVPSVLWFRINKRNNQLAGLSEAEECLYIPDKYYILGHAVAVYYIPTIVMVVTYLLLFYSLRKRQRDVMVRESMSRSTGTDSSDKVGFTRQENYVPKKKDFTNTESHDDNIGPETNNIARVEKSTNPEMKRDTFLTEHAQKISDQNRRCITTLGGIILVFSICWLPFVAFWPIKAFCETCIPVQLYKASYWLSYTNSFVNPFIYFLLNKDYQNALKCIFRGKQQR